MSVSNLQRENPQEKLQLFNEFEGSEQLNTFCLLLNHIKFSDSRYPSEKEILTVLKGVITNLSAVSSILNERAKKCVNISFLEEEDVISFEKKIRSGIKYPGSLDYFKGYRVDKKYLRVKLIGAPCWVEKCDVVSLFQRWGTVIDATRGTSFLSLPGGVEGVFGTGYIY